MTAALLPETTHGRTTPPRGSVTRATPPEATPPQVTPPRATPHQVTPHQVTPHQVTLPRVTGAELTVPLVDGSRVRYCDLDSAASTPALESVAAHVAEVLPYYGSVHRGAGWTSRVCTSLVENARTDVARFVRARTGDCVVFTRNTTDALALLARAVRARS
ncbi:Aminotransferase class-V [Pseudonocardia ammonioxydans]|uniref:Aminotransferase class-V n=1 Tax=Pseudonocardia ammonioxydans TaxID=260086 RepID=A0A1I4Y1U8_PSUAM|nr:Aminotransferase class-V [Pseudonocardia ammonioxydans]